MTSKSHRIIQTSLHSYMESKNPMKLFDVWYCDACKNPAVKAPAIMSLATIKNNGKPLAQIVKMQTYDQTGFKFLTDDKHLKSIGSNKTHAALVLYWELLNRQIRVEGVIEKLPENETKLLLDELSNDVTDNKQENFVSFVVKPERFEFWQHQSRSMHDRIMFFPLKENENKSLCYNGDDGWGYQWLEP